MAGCSLRWAGVASSAAEMSKPFIVDANLQADARQAAAGAELRRRREAGEPVSAPGPQSFVTCIYLETLATLPAWVWLTESSGS